MTSSPTPRNVERLLDRYRLGKVLRVEVFDVGHINSSFRVDLDDSNGARRIFVQRINSYVFPRPDHVMTNVTAVVEHLRGGPLGALELLRGPEGETSLIDDEGETWRAFNYIEHARLGRVPEELEHIRAASFAFGAFHRGVQDLPTDGLEITIEHFHDTPHRFGALDRAVAEDRAGRLEACRVELDASLEARPIASAVTRELGSAAMPLRCVHNDAKFSNVLLAPDTFEPLCVVDLDTVMPGSVLYDLGHMVRSMSHTFEEDVTDRDLGVDPSRFSAILEGYFAAAPDLLTSEERESIVVGTRVMVLQEAIRFLTDHLDGDLYFKVKRPDQNLDRCRMHLALFAALGLQEGELLALVPPALEAARRRPQDGGGGRETIRRSPGRA